MRALRLLTRTPPPNSDHLLDRMLRDVRTGRFEQTLAALTAVGAAITAAEIYTEHDAASFGNKMMWWPVAVLPTVIPAGIEGDESRIGRAGAHGDRFTACVEIGDLDPLIGRDRRGRPAIIDTDQCGLDRLFGGQSGKLQGKHRNRDHRTISHAAGRNGDQFA